VRFEDGKLAEHWDVLQDEAPFAEDQGSNAGTDLYERPVPAIDPGMHTASIRSQAVDAALLTFEVGLQD
jgi:hypothetical protein